jgi:hypothetical protein
MCKSQENKTFKTTLLWFQAFCSNKKLGKLIFSFSTSHFLCPISTNSAPTPRSLQPHTHQNKTKQPINFYPCSLITCAFIITTSTNYIPFKWMINDKIQVGCWHLDKDRQPLFIMWTLENNREIFPGHSFTKVGS